LNSPRRDSIGVSEVVVDKRQPPWPARHKWAALLLPALAIQARSEIWQSFTPVHVFQYSSWTLMVLWSLGPSSRWTPWLIVSASYSVWCIVPRTPWFFVSIDLRRAKEYRQQNDQNCDSSLSPFHFHLVVFLNTPSEIRSSFIRLEFMFAFD